MCSTILYACFLTFWASFASTAALEHPLTSSCCHNLDFRVSFEKYPYHRLSFLDTLLKESHHSSNLYKSTAVSAADDLMFKCYRTLWYLTVVTLLNRCSIILVNVLATLTQLILFAVCSWCGDVVRSSSFRAVSATAAGNVLPSIAQLEHEVNLWFSVFMRCRDAYMSSGSGH